MKRATRRLTAPAIALVLAAAWACGDGGPDHAPSPQIVATAEANSRAVTIGAPFSTTPAPGDDDRDEPVVLGGRVFGDGPTGIVLGHMRPADQTSWFAFASRLAASGDYTILTFDFRGYPQSPGEKEFDRVDTDMQAALEYMRDDLGIRRAYLVGASLGGTAALIVAAREPDAVAGVISISSPARYQQLDALDGVGRITVPKLFIASEDDLAAIRSLDEMWTAAREPRDREVYPGDAHGTDLFASPSADAFDRRLEAFLVPLRAR